MEGKLAKEMKEMLTKNNSCLSKIPHPCRKRSLLSIPASVVSWSTEKTKYEIINFYWLKLRSFKYHQLADVLYIIFTREARLEESISLEHVWQAQREGRGRKTPQTSTPTLPTLALSMPFMQAKKQTINN